MSTDTGNRSRSAKHVTGTPKKDIRWVGLEVLAGAIPYEKADAVLRQAEYRAVCDDALMAELSERSSSPWQQR